MERPIYIIEGSRFSDFPGFVEEFNRMFISTFGVRWNGNLDAFKDYLSRPETNYILEWRDAQLSRQALGHDAMSLWLSQNIQRCHPANIPEVSKRLQTALLSEGPTMFDLLVEIIHDSQPWVELRLE